MATQQSIKQEDPEQPVRPKPSVKNSRLPFLVVLLAGLYIFFTQKYLGRVILGVLAFSLVILIELLIWHNQAILFFKVIGMELLVLIIIGWVFSLIYTSAKPDQ